MQQDANNQNINFSFFAVYKWQSPINFAAL
jgi:hypothetical protein